MRVSIPKSLAAGMAAIVLSTVATLTSAPADAAMGGFRPGGFDGFHGGMGGFRGPAIGGFRPGGFHGGMGAFHPGGFGFHRRFFARDDLRRRFFDRDVFINRNVFVGGPGGCWGGWCNGGWWWPGFASGAIVGAAATYPYYGAGYGYGDGCRIYRPVYRHGIYVGRRIVNICY
jgi:hypothetical protein